MDYLRHDLMPAAERFAAAIHRHREASRELDLAEAEWLASLAAAHADATSQIRVGPWEFSHDGPSRTWDARLAPPTGGEQ